MPIAGGTDLIPNMKHRLFTPRELVALGGIEAMRGVERGEGGELRIGAGETLAALGRSALVMGELPALAAAARGVAGPQLRNRGTLGGNLCLDTRCTYYNQTAFWREALGYCLKKDGDVCHVTKVGAKCVAAHSADTPPVLIALGAGVEVAGPDGVREVGVEELFVADGVRNVRLERGELVVRVRVPGTGEGLRRLTGYAKLRQRGSIDFPLLTVAVAVWLDEEERVAAIRGVVTGLGSRPRVLSGWEAIAVGEPWSDQLFPALAERAHAQCRPLENMTTDPDWRRAMVPVYVRRALEGVG